MDTLITHEKAGGTRKPSGNAGFSLTELLVATLVACVAATSLASFTAAQGRAFRRAQERLTANQTLRLILEVLSRDLRQAGFDARGAALAPVEAAGSTTLVLQQDLDADGLINARSSEVISYSFRPAAGTLSRIVGRQSMPLATGLPPDGFRLSYLDENGAVLDSDARDLNPTERAAIRLVQVAILWRGAGGETLARITTAVALRNHPWAHEPGRS